MQVNTFTLLSDPSIMLACKSRLCVAINYSDQALYLISMFNMRSLKKYTHGIDSDHKYLITDLVSHSLSRIFISVARDKTLKLWDRYNSLLATLSLSCVPTCLCLVNEKADSVFSMNNMLFYVRTSEFVPDCILNTLVGAKSDEPRNGLPNLLFGPLDQLQSSCISYLSSQRDRIRSLFYSAQFLCYNQRKLEQFVPLAQHVVPNISVIDKFPNERTEFVPIPILKSCTNYQKVSWNDYFLSHLNSPYEMVIHHNTFDVADAYLQGK